VATENGGPVDIIANCENGVLVDPLDKQAIADALIGVLGDRERWAELSANGLEAVREHYSWHAHAETYLGRVKPLPKRHERIPETPPARRPLRYRDRALFTDLDQSLLGSPEGVRRFAEVMRENRKCVTFGIATGRRLDSAMSILKKHGLPLPDVLITSLGTQIHYSRNLLPDDYWASHIDHVWKPLTVRRTLADIPGLVLQPRSEQTRFKVSYHYDPSVAPGIEEINTLLRSKEVTANVIHSFGQFLDVVPARASKGHALRYVAQRWEMPLDHILVAGGSGADEDMMRGNTLAVVVANRHHEELSGLEEQERIYFAAQDHAFGILEAIDHYDFFSTCRAPVPEES
jgi:sucrose-phosphate synthase